MLPVTRKMIAFPVLVIAVIALFIGCSTDSPVESSSTINSASDGQRSSFGNVAKNTGPPAEGIVVEGESVPGGISLGDTRADVLAAYGNPHSTDLDSTTYRYRIDGLVGREAHFHFGDGYGGPPHNLPSDVVTFITWWGGVTGWYTTAGINSTIAIEDPEAVIAAYPDAQVTRGGDYDFISEIRAWEQGFLVRRSWNFYGGFVSATLHIFNPRPAPPPPPPIDSITYVWGIDMEYQKTKGKLKVAAFVKVRNHYDRAAGGATVVARWITPDDGGIQNDIVNVISTTSSSGNAYFETMGGSNGNYTLVVEDVILEGHTFDSNNSVLTETISVGSKSSRK